MFISIFIMCKSIWVFSWTFCILFVHLLSVKWSRTIRNAHFFSFSFILSFNLSLSSLCSCFRNTCSFSLSWDKLVIFVRHKAFLSFYSLWDDMIFWLQGFIWSSLAPLMLAVPWEHLEANHVQPTQLCSCRLTKQHRLVPAPQSV